MRNWFKKPSDKKTKDEKPAEGEEKQHNISTLYEIVEDHLKSLDYEQLKSISGDFAERFAAHKEIISEIVKTPPPRRDRGKAAATQKEPSPDEFVIIDTRPHAGSGFGAGGQAGPYTDELVLSHYDRMIRSQYDRIIDLTMDFLKGVTEAEVRRLDAETAKVASSVEELRDTLTGQIKGLVEDLDETRRAHEDLIADLQEAIDEGKRRAELAATRIKILIYAVIGAGLVGGAALVLAIVL